MSYQRESGQSHTFVVIPMVSFGDFFLFFPQTCHRPSNPSPPLISSWTEDTRSRIFSDAALQLGTDGRRPVAAELDTQIEQKFGEFDELMASGQSVLGKEHHLTQMVSGLTDRRPLLVPLFCDVALYCLAGDGAHGGAEEHARLDPGALEGPEATVAPSERKTGARAR